MSRYFMWSSSAAGNMHRLPHDAQTAGISTGFSSTEYDACSRIGRRRVDSLEPGAIRMRERLLLAAHDQRSLLLVGPGAVVVESNRDGVTFRPERVLEEWLRTDAVGRRAAHRFQAE